MAKETHWEHPPRGHVGLAAYDTVNDRWQAVHVDADGNVQVDITAILTGQIQLYGWDGDSWEKVNVDGNGYLKVVLPYEEALGARAYQYDGDSWVRSNILWGYNDRWAERHYTTNASEGNNTLSTDAVPADYLHIVQACSCLDKQTDPSAMRMNVQDGTCHTTLGDCSFPGAGQRLMWSGAVVLKEGDVIDAYYEGCSAGDDLYFDVWGYKMRLDM